MPRARGAIAAVLALVAWPGAPAVAAEPEPVAVRTEEEGAGGKMLRKAVRGSASA